MENFVSVQLAHNSSFIERYDTSLLIEKKVFTFRDNLNEFNDNCGASDYSIIYKLLI